jgi:zinc protease
MDMEFPMLRHAKNRWPLLLVVLCLGQLAAAADRIEYTEETLNNGLRVIYAPLRQAPVVHVRVLYHVGSRDERPDRQGFAHMFEHMMFRGSEHVKPEQHMKLIGMVGGMSNAFTSFDQTVYVNTIPANHLEMALYLEADRMASFKVSDEIFQIERRVVAEEWRRRQNQPYGTVFEEFLKLAITQHPYRWTPIGKMEHLAAATAGELQDFFNTYYVPNNAVLVVAGDIDIPATKKLVEKYYAWIPKGADIQRQIPKEPQQTQPKSKQVGKPVPLAQVMIGYKGPEYRSDDHYALTLLATILGGGRSSRLDNLLVNSPNPLCVSAGAFDYALEDGAIITVNATVLGGKDVNVVEKLVAETIAAVIDKGVTPEELEKARIQERVSFVRARETAEKIASALGDEALFGGDAARANQTLEKLNAVTAADVQAVARKYLLPAAATTYRVQPDPQAKETAAAPETPAAGDPTPKITRKVTFPADYPAQPPIADAKIRASFAKGTESAINGVKVIVLPDNRLPFVAWSLTMRAGSHADPAGKEGLADLTADLVRRGAGGLSFVELNEDLERRGISIAVSDGGDYTRLSGSCLTEQLEHALLRSRQTLLSPTLADEDFVKLKEQTLNQLRLAQAQPETAASQTLAESLYGTSPLGRYATPKSVASITLDDVKAWYQRAYRPNDAVLVVSGDVTVERGRALAAKLLAGWEAGDLPRVTYDLPPTIPARRIILIDRPEGKQAMIRMAIPAYTVKSDEQFAGRLANGILSFGIDSRLGRYVRAEKGYAYSVYGYFRPGRQAGEFAGGTETDVKNTANAIEAMFKVCKDMARDGITETELKEAKLRTVGSLVMGMQTIQAQANYRVEGILNGYPLDYYDVFPERIAAVSPSQVGQVVDKYVKDGQMTVVIVAPAAAAREQLERLGKVEVIPMPEKGEGK